MSRESKKRRELRIERMFETRSEAWEAVGLPLEVDEHVVRKAWMRLAVELPLLVGTIYVIARTEKGDWFSNQLQAARIIEGIAIFILGWLISRDLAKLAPTFFKRLDPATAGTVEFLTRFATVATTVIGALVVAGVDPAAIVAASAFTAVVVGLAAQQTLGNLIAGTVLVTARPFRLGELVRLQAGATGGGIEGVVSSLGLLYTTLARGEDRILIPNNVVLNAVVVPLREPDALDIRVRLASAIRASQVHELLEDGITVQTRAPGISVLLEEIDGDDVVMRIRATPERDSDAPKLADEVIAALTGLTREQPRVVRGASAE